MEAALVNMDHIPSINATFVVPSEIPIFNTSAYRAYLDPSTQYYHVRLQGHGAPPTPRPTRVSTGGPARALARIRARVPAPLYLRPLTEDVTPPVQATSAEDIMPSVKDTLTEEVNTSVRDILTEGEMPSSKDPSSKEVTPNVQATLTKVKMHSVQDTSSEDVIPFIQEMTVQDTIASHTVDTVMPTVATSASFTPAAISPTAVDSDIDCHSKLPSQASAVQLTATSSSDTPSAMQPMPALSSVTLPLAPLSTMSVDMTPASSTQESHPNWADLVEEEQGEDSNTASSSSSSSQNDDTSPLPSPITPPTPDFQMSFGDGQPMKTPYIDVKGLSLRCVALDLSLTNQTKPRPVPGMVAPSDTFLRERFFKTLDLAIQECNNTTWAGYVLGIYRRGGYDWEAPSSSSGVNYKASVAAVKPKVVEPSKLRKCIPVIGSEEYEEQYDHELKRANAVEWRQQDYVTVEKFAQSNAEWRMMYNVLEELILDGHYRRPALGETDRSLDWFWNITNKNNSPPYDPREFSSPQNEYTPPKSKEVEEIHHLNFSHEPVSHKTATEPEVSLWAAWSIGLVGWRHDAGLTRRRVLASQAAKLLDPFYCDDKMDTAILELQGDALRKAAAGFVRKVYSEGTWVNDQYDSKASTPVSGDEYQCIDIYCEGHYPAQSYFIYPGVDGDSNVNDDGQPAPFMRSKVHKPKGCSKRRIIENNDGEITVIACGKVMATAQPVVNKSVVQPERPRMFVFGAGTFLSQLQASAQGTKVPPNVLEATEASVEQEAVESTDEDSGDASVDERSQGYLAIIGRASQIPNEDKAAYLRIHSHIGGVYDEVVSSTVGNDYDYTSETADADDGTRMDRQQMRSAYSEDVSGDEDRDNEPGTPENGSFLDDPFTSDLSWEKPRGQYGMLTPNIKHALENFVNADDEDTDDFEEEGSQYSEDSPSKRHVPRPSAPTPGKSLSMRVPFENSLKGESLNERYDEDHLSGGDEYESDDESLNADEFLALWTEDPGRRMRKVGLDGRLAVLPVYDDDFLDVQDKDLVLRKGFGYDGGLRDPRTENVEVPADSIGDIPNLQVNDKANDGVSGKKSESVDDEDLEDDNAVGSNNKDSVVHSDNYYTNGQGSTSETDENTTDVNDHTAESGDSSHGGITSTVEDTPEPDGQEFTLVLYDPSFYTRIFPSNNVTHGEVTDDIAAAPSQALTQNFAYGAGDQDYFDQDSVIDEDEEKDENDVPTPSDTIVAKETVFSPEEQRTINQFLVSQIPGLDQLNSMIRGHLPEAPTPGNQNIQPDEAASEADDSVRDVQTVNDPTPPRAPWYEQPRYSENRIVVELSIDSENGENHKEDLPELEVGDEDTNVTPVDWLMEEIFETVTSEQQQEQLAKPNLSPEQSESSDEDPITTSISSTKEDCHIVTCEQPGPEEFSEEELLSAPFEVWKDLSEIPDIRLSWPQFIYSSFTISLGQKAREILRFS